MARAAWASTTATSQWEATGERLTKETFERYRRERGTVILHFMKEEWIETALGNDWVIVASDGMPYAPKAHPRTAGTYSRVLGRYVRERGTLDLMTALLKMTLLPADRVASMSDQMRRKGRIQVGADADIVVFDPDTVIDTATFEGGLSFSEGIVHTIVNGVFVVRDGETVEGVAPGAGDCWAVGGGAGELGRRPLRLRPSPDPLGRPPFRHRTPPAADLPSAFRRPSARKVDLALVR